MPYLGPAQAFVDKHTLADWQANLGTVFAASPDREVVSELFRVEGQIRRVATKARDW